MILFILSNTGSGCFIAIFKEFKIFLNDLDGSTNNINEFKKIMDTVVKALDVNCPLFFFIQFDLQSVLLHLRYFGIRHNMDLLLNQLTFPKLPYLTNFNTVPFSLAHGYHRW